MFSDSFLSLVFPEKLAFATRTTVELIFPVD